MPKLPTPTGGEEQSKIDENTMKIFKEDYLKLIEGKWTEDKSNKQFSKSYCEPKKYMTVVN